MSQAQPTPRPPLLRRPAFWLIVIATLLLIAVATAVGFALGAGRDTEASTSDAPTPGAVATDAATTPPATETAAPPAPAPVVEIPASCADIYTRDWSAELGGLVVNPPWTEAPGNGPLWGSNDSGAITVLEATTRLTCAWVGSSGGGDVGIITNLAQLTPEQEVSTATYLESAGQACFEELGGIRCVVEWNSEAGDSGESHFFREGIWSATRWSNVSADGYTHDIVSTLFG